MGALLAGWRRWLAPIVLVVLAAPSIGMLVSPGQTRSTAENRTLAPIPILPSSPATWAVFPHAVNAYFDDHFAFRRRLISIDSQLRWRFGGQIGGGEVLRGKADRLFLRDNLLIVTGAKVRPKTVDDTGAFVCALHDQLRERSVALVFAMAPSAAVIYPEDLPDWVPRSAPSEADLLLAKVRVCGVRTADLRPALAAAKPSGSIYYHHDTHWTDKGALIAYNVLVKALDRPDWTAPPQSFRWAEVRENLADLQHMAGASDLRVETMQAPDLAAQRRMLSETLIDGVDNGPGQSSALSQTGHPGPTVLIIGDSFSQTFMPPYFAAHVGRIAWLHHRQCRFDQTVFDRVKPDYVIFMPADRLASCAPGARALQRP